MRSMRSMRLVASAAFRFKDAALAGREGFARVDFLDEVAGVGPHDGLGLFFGEGQRRLIRFFLHIERPVVTPGARLGGREGWRGT